MQLANWIHVSSTLFLIGFAGAPRPPSTPPPRFGSKVRPALSAQRPSALSPGGSPRFGAGGMSGFKGIEASRKPPVASSSDLLTQMKERKDLEQEAGSSPSNINISCKHRPFFQSTIPALLTIMSSNSARCTVERISSRRIDCQDTRLSL
jgi:hypothetical protein